MPLNEQIFSERSQESAVGALSAGDCACLFYCQEMSGERELMAEADG